MKAPIDAPQPERAAWDAGYVAGVEYERDRKKFTAGDLYLAALDEWFAHCLGCDADTCETCVTVLNRARLARKVWQSSAHAGVA